jgi:DNA-binding NtrC family response regulator
MLEYSVRKMFLARDGLESLQIYRKNRKTIDPAIAGKIMPKMVVFKLAKEIHTIGDNIPTICSGHFDVITTREDGKAAIWWFFAKPLDKFQLFNKIHELLPPEVLDENISH